MYLFVVRKKKLLRSYLNHNNLINYLTPKKRLGKSLDEHFLSGVPNPLCVHLGRPAGGRPEDL
jgi:hypothetical protein